jgi:hypothetical protein
MSEHLPRLQAPAGIQKAVFENWAKRHVERIGVLGVHFDCLDMKALIERIEECMRSEDKFTIAFSNPEHTLEAQYNPGHSSYLQGCRFNVADGVGIGTVHLAGNRVNDASTAIDRQSRTVKIIHDGNSFDLAFALFADGDTTPSVLEGSHFRAANKRSTVITNFDDGYEGQRITVVFDTANSRVDFTETAFKGNGGMDWPAEAGDYMECVFDGNFWYCTTSHLR